ncbi:hypothetical protein ONE63_009399 [Megalurothrips usitatus]|uniref:Uncharacterized protein n=1 Tax=Megalurothrips usitatus TaxID=439358 RepID=A0AAV7XJH3_9NEOP|nr:hypothetical protein ONE63_009399 [Megalurothrips usitatus]
MPARLPSSEWCEAFQLQQGVGLRVAGVRMQQQRRRRRLLRGDRSQQQQHHGPERRVSGRAAGPRGAPSGGQPPTANPPARLPAQPSSEEVVPAELWAAGAAAGAAQTPEAPHHALSL